MPQDVCRQRDPEDQAADCDGVEQNAVFPEEKLHGVPVDCLDGVICT